MSNSAQRGDESIIGDSNSSMVIDGLSTQGQVGSVHGAVGVAAGRHGMFDALPTACADDKVFHYILTSDFGNRF